MNKIFNLLSSNQLKILALIAMTIDHIGVQILPQYDILRIIGRISFPIFAFMIAEGCRYTRSRSKYLLKMSGLAVICQVVFYIADGSLYQSVLVTFSLGIGLVYAVDYALKKGSMLACLLAVFALFSVYFICEILPEILSHTDFLIDYGFWGAVMPLLVYVMHNKTGKLLMMTVAMIGIALNYGGNQWYSLIALIPLAVYSGQRGKIRLKEMFYLYYPLHLVAIYAVDMFLLG
ncbi:MAG: hypothetical protein IJA41_04830 [Clostridia bacterium]|nr:hypothetical protein [Clostridia bacterium]